MPRLECHMHAQRLFEANGAAPLIGNFRFLSHRFSPDVRHLGGMPRFRQSGSAHSFGDGHPRACWSDPGLAQRLGARSDLRRAFPESAETAQYSRTPASGFSRDPDGSGGLRKRVDASVKAARRTIPFASRFRAAPCRFTSGHRASSGFVDTWYFACEMSVTAQSQFAKRYPKEFRQQAVEQPRAGRSLYELSRELGCSRWAISRRQASRGWAR